MKKLINISLLLIAVTILFSGCGVYSFTGASVPAGAKTVSVQYFPNKAQLVEPILSPTFTNRLLDIFTTQTTLEMVETNGDIAIDGEIISYKTTPVAIQADQTAAMNRLTIVVNVRFVNKLEPEKDFEQKFSQFLEYPSDSDLNSVSAELISAINEMLATDIFNKAVVNW